MPKQSAYLVWFYDLKTWFRFILCIIQCKVHSVFKICLSNTGCYGKYLQVIHFHCVQEDMFFSEMDKILYFSTKKSVVWSRYGFLPNLFVRVFKLWQINTFRDYINCNATAIFFVYKLRLTKQDDLWGLRAESYTLFFHQIEP